MSTEARSSQTFPGSRPSDGRADLRIAVLQHEPATGLGTFGDLLVQVGVETELIRAWRDPLPEARAFDGVIVLGGSARASDPALAAERRWIAMAVLAETPYLGICLGAQLLAAGLGAPVVAGWRPEIGIGDVFLTDAARRDTLFRLLPGRLRVFQWHADTFGLPSGAVPLAGSIDYRYQAFRWGPYAYGLQFHPEATARAVAGWPWTPRYLDQLQMAGVDAGAVVAELAEEEPRLRRLAAVFLDRWLEICVGAAASRSPSAARRTAVLA